MVSSRFWKVAVMLPPPTNDFTQAEVTFNLVAAVTESKNYTDTQ